MNEQLQPQFTKILDLIKNTQNYVIATSNQELIKLYWSIGKYIDDRLNATEWGKKLSSNSLTLFKRKNPALKALRSVIWNGCVSFINSILALQLRQHC
jgi:hypothetical protein